MNEGAFAMLDCLGFKGIWARHPNFTPEDLNKKFSGIEKELTEELTRYDKSAAETNIQTVFLSDTIVVSATAKQVIDGDMPADQRSEQKGWLLYLVALHCHILIRKFASSDPVLTMRGYITYGEHFVDRTFLVGPAVDETAENYEKANGAFVWIAPQHRDSLSRYTRSLIERFTAGLGGLASECVVTQRVNHLGLWGAIPTRGGSNELSDIWQSLSSEQKSRNFSFVDSGYKRFYADDFFIDEYAMPLKGVGTLDCAVLAPFFSVNFYSVPRLTQKILNSFDIGSLSIDVLLKRQHTKALLDHAKARREAVVSELIAQLKASG